MPRLTRRWLLHTAGLASTASGITRLEDLKGKTVETDVVG